MELEVIDIKGNTTGKKVSLNDDVFAVDYNEHVLYLTVKNYLANQRQGTHKAKERAEITGSTRKIKKQKGTGTARAGSIKNPLFRGGGRVFGPRPRNYGFKLNKKTRKLARKVALSDKCRNEKLIVIENFDFEKPSTKEYLGLLNNLGLTDSKSLLVLENTDKNVYLSSRNLKQSIVSNTSELNTYDVLNSQSLVLSEAAIEVLNANSNK